LFDIRNIIPTIKYLHSTTIHKYYVFQAGRWTKTSLWRRLVHDWTKYTSAEAPHYGRQLFGAADDNVGFITAWNHHHKANPHHWEYWIPATTHTRGSWVPGEPLPMPEIVIREMVADWLGAGRHYTGSWAGSVETWGWYNEWKDRIVLHADTRVKLEAIIAETFANKDAERVSKLTKTLKN
jgi:hypothetical protein